MTPRLVHLSYQAKSEGYIRKAPSGEEGPSINDPETSAPKEHTEICKDSSIGVQIVSSLISHATSMGIVSADDYDDTVNAKDGMSAVELVFADCSREFDELEIKRTSALITTDLTTRATRKDKVILRMKKEVKMIMNTALMIMIMKTEIGVKMKMKAECVKNTRSFAATCDAKKAEDAENTDYVFTENPNELVDRLKILIAEQRSENHANMKETKKTHGLMERLLNIDRKIVFVEHVVLIVVHVEHVEHVKQVEHVEHMGLIVMLDVRTEHCRNTRAEETGYLRENPPTSGIVWHDSHVRKSGIRLGRGGEGRRAGQPLSLRCLKAPAEAVRDSHCRWWQLWVAVVAADSLGEGQPVPWWRLGEAGWTPGRVLEQHKASLKHMVFTGSFAGTLEFRVVCSYHVWEWSGDIWAALNLQVLRADEGEARGKQNIPEKTYRPAALSITIPTCENPGIEPSSPTWQESCLTTTLSLPQRAKKLWFGKTVSAPSSSLPTKLTKNQLIRSANNYTNLKPTIMLDIFTCLLIVSTTARSLETMEVAQRGSEGPSQYSPQVISNKTWRIDRRMAAQTGDRPSKVPPSLIINHSQMRDGETSTNQITLKDEASSIYRLVIACSVQRRPQISSMCNMLPVIDSVSELVTAK
ncbi:hypothetical protein PR048_007305 [Dryococelus australis]|uniref:Uncharacterized protein n=1 Tax=Dryococelus australis TaxID=614101 RepID=A0ABQ9ID95_9NEOP|nr:hypothetical protein PR048_007305 [Dryococelus australis]